MRSIKTNSIQNQYNFDEAVHNIKVQRLPVIFKSHKFNDNVR